MRNACTHPAVWLIVGSKCVRDTQFEFVNHLMKSCRRLYVNVNELSSSQQKDFVQSVLLLLFSSSFILVVSGNPVLSGCCTHIYVCFLNCASSTMLYDRDLTSVLLAAYLSADVASQEFLSQLRVSSFPCEATVSPMLQHC